jgi:hypothetical protein
MSNLGMILVVILVILLLWFLFCGENRSIKENMGGFGVITGLSYNNRLQYCDPGNEHLGGSRSPSVYIPHRVII